MENLTSNDAAYKKAYDEFLPDDDDLMESVKRDIEKELKRLRK